MKLNTTIQPASTVGAPFLSKDAALQMSEYAEGIAAQKAGKRATDCPYSISNVVPRLMSSEWRERFENRFHAWQYGFTEINPS